jgi:hypothetical protein
MGTVKALETGFFFRRGSVLGFHLLGILRDGRRRGQEICTRRLRKRATLSIGAPLGNLEVGSFTGAFETQQYLGSFSWTQRMLGA